MNVWMVVYKGLFSGQWLLSIDFPVRAQTRDAARKYMRKYPNATKDGGYKIVKFSAALPVAPKPHAPRD